MCARPPNGLIYHLECVSSYVTIHSGWFLFNIPTWNTKYYWCSPECHYKCSIGVSRKVKMLHWNFEHTSGVGIGYFIFLQ